MALWLSPAPGSAKDSGGMGAVGERFLLPVPARSQQGPGDGEAGASGGQMQEDTTCVPLSSAESATPHSHSSWLEQGRSNSGTPPTSRSAGESGCSSSGRGS